ncbi:hypothetical protein CYMTET_19398 [Cymbomonas tetramitiformis]|uniref:Uncharacterized protein n=1 Tax=Cymbomonas tetramitiformis TaxID=36881 RepID=A0AAE0G6M9_9CHLO|nr:hypothetical protein CYMTET_19398 [Cymbomonas tetramitiformis]
MKDGVSGDAHVFIQPPKHDAPAFARNATIPQYAMTAIAPENTELASAVEAYAKQDAAEWLALMAEHSAGITPMYQRIDVNEGEDDGADARASQRKRKRAAALTDETAPSEGVRASITPPLIDVLRIVQQANLVRTGARPSRANNGVNVATVNEYMIPRTDTPVFQGLAGSVCVSEKHLLRWIVKDGVHKIDQSALRYRPEDRMRLHNANVAGQLF